MATPDPADKEPTPNSFDWTKGCKIRDGRYGPVFLGLRTDTGDLISAEEVTVTPGGQGGTASSSSSSSSSLEDIVAALDSRLAADLAAGPQPNVVSLLGYELLSGEEEGEGAKKVVVLAEYLPGGTLRDLVRGYGAAPRPLARLILRQVVLGLQQLHERGRGPVFPGLDTVMLDSKGVAKIEAPLPGVTAPPPPELVLGEGEGDLGWGADVWLLGLVAAQLLTGEGDLGLGLGRDDAAGFGGDSALDLLVVPGGAAGGLDRDAADLIRRCLSLDASWRPGISALLEHPFFTSVD